MVLLSIHFTNCFNITRRRTPVYQPKPWAGHQRISRHTRTVGPRVWPQRPLFWRGIRKALTRCSNHNFHNQAACRPLDYPKASPETRCNRITTWMTLMPWRWMMLQLQLCSLLRINTSHSPSLAVNSQEVSPSTHSPHLPFRAKTLPRQLRRDPVKTSVSPTTLPSPRLTPQRSARLLATALCVILVSST